MFKMKRFLRVFSSVILVAALLISNVSAYAATKKTDIKNNIATVENALNTQNTDVISELHNQINEYQIALANADGTEEQSKIERLIVTTKTLIRDYSNYKKQSDKSAIQSSNDIYSAAVATVIAYFSVNNYKLSAELLTHARDNEILNSPYDPEYGYRCYSSPVVDAIWKSMDYSSTAVFPKKPFQSDELDDLAYAIHGFSFTAHHDSDNYLEIVDTYDYAYQTEYTGVAGVAVETMYQAQEAGVITPYVVVIDLYF